MESKIKTSASRISTYKQCPRKYYYRYIKELPVFSFWGQLIKGNFAHAVLEKWTYRLINKENPRTAMVHAYKEALSDKQFKGKVERFLSEIKPWLQQAIIDYETKSFEPTTIEAKVSFNYRNIKVTGRIDRIDNISPQKVKVVDYKSTKSPNYLTPMQLGIYHIGVKYGSMKEVYGKKDVETAYILLRHNMKEVSYNFTEEQLDEVLTDIEESVDLINNDTIWEPRPSQLCQYCDFLVPCTKERGLYDFNFEGDGIFNL